MGNSAAGEEVGKNMATLCGDWSAPRHIARQLPLFGLAGQQGRLHGRGDADGRAPSSRAGRAEDPCAQARLPSRQAAGRARWPRGGGSRRRPDDRENGTGNGRGRAGEARGKGEANLSAVAARACELRGAPCALASRVVVGLVDGRVPPYPAPPLPSPLRSPLLPSLKHWPPLRRAENAAAWRSAA